MERGKRWSRVPETFQGYNPWKSGEITSVVRLPGIQPVTAWTLLGSTSCPTFGYGLALTIRGVCRVRRCCFSELGPGVFNDCVILGSLYRCSVVLGDQKAAKGER